MRAHESARALHDLDLALLGQHAQAAGQLLDDRALPAAQLLEVDLRRAEGDAMGAHLLGVLDDLGRMQQRLGGNAADIQTHAAQRRPTLHQITFMPRSAARNAAV